MASAAAAEILVRLVKLLVTIAAGVLVLKQQQQLVALVTGAGEGLGR
jgi:hypothetical protein